MRPLAVSAITLFVALSVFACYVVLRMPAWLGPMMQD